MGSKVEEALRAKAFAEKQFVEKDFRGAKKYALKAQMLLPELEGISQMVATFGVYVTSEAKINGELDFYAILGLNPSVDKSKIKKQYKKMAVLLHPDKNRTIGADEAFRLISEAWTLLSDSVKRSSYDQRRNLYAGYTTAAAGYDNCSQFPAPHSRLDTFWTVCTSCHVQYEYLRKYVNKRLSCKNCRAVFIAIEISIAPMSVPFQYSDPYPYVSGSHGTHVAKASGYHAPPGHTRHHTGYGSDYVSNISFQGNSSVNSAVVPNGISTSSFVFCQANGKTDKAKPNKEHSRVKVTGHMASNGHTGSNGLSRAKRGRPSKKVKMEFGSSFTNGREEISPNVAAEEKTASLNGSLKPASRLSSSFDTSTRRFSAFPAVDTKQLLIEKGRSVIRRKLEEMRLASEAAAAEAEKSNAHGQVDKFIETAKVSGASGAGFQTGLKRTSMLITVPDSDFHDFDNDRSEECFKPKQIWALYDEEDGMPRLYCLIRQIVSVNPFKIFISYLSSKTDCEFGSVKWLESGFTKSCGSFRVFQSEMVERVNIFSHLLSREKAGRGGCIRIYPRGGDIWAVYRNWSPDWNRSTPDEVRHQYEMVEILGDYSEENGVWVRPLIKLGGYMTVYQSNADTNAIRWIQRREMLRFSHQVPSCSLKVEGTNLPEGCWDLDPAAIPEELLQGEIELENNSSLVLGKKTIYTPANEHCPPEAKGHSEEKPSQSEVIASTPINGPQVELEASVEKRTLELFPGQEKTTV